MASITKLFLCLLGFFLFTINALKNNEAPESNEEETEKAPFVKNINFFFNNRGTKLAKNVIGATKGYLTKYGEEWVDTMNKNHSKNRQNQNSFARNLIKYNIVDPTKAFSQVGFRKLSRLGSDINRTYHKYEKSSEIIHPNAMEPIKKLSKKPISLSRATMDVLAKKGSDFIKKISMDENSEENNDEVEEIKENKKSRRTTERKK